MWGFHEAKLGAEDVRARMPHVERIIREARRVVGEAR